MYLLTRRLCVVVATLALFECITASALHAQQADHSRCANYVNNPRSDQPGNERYAFRIHLNGPFVPDRLRYMPFDIQQDGSIRLHERPKGSHGEIVSQETNRTDDGTETVIYHLSAPLEALQVLDGRLIAPSTKRTVRTIVVRDASGNISEIIEDQNLSTEELDALRAAADPNDRYFAFLGTRTEYSVRNGECVPMRSSVVLFRATAAGDQRTEILTFSTSLCSDISELLEENFRTAIAFNAGVNRQFAGLLYRHLDDVTGSRPGYEPFLSEEFTKDILDSTISREAVTQSLEIQALIGYNSSAREDNEDLRRLNQKLFGVSPLISINMMQANCFFQRLGAFMRPDGPLRR